MHETVKAISRRTARGGYGLAWVVVIACLAIVFVAALYVEEYVDLAFALNDLGVLKYVLWFLATALLAVTLRAEPRRKDRSRAAGGAGLRFGQGPLPSWQRFDRWLDRWAGTFLGDLAVTGFWLFGAVASILCALVHFLHGVLLVTLVVAAAYAGSQLIGGRQGAVLFLALLPLGSYLTLRVLRRSTRRFPAAWVSVVIRRICAITNRALDRLVIRSDAPAEPPHDARQPRRIYWDP